MEKDKNSNATQSELGLQVVPQTEEVEIIFTVSDGLYSDLPTAEEHYTNEIKSETKELRKLQVLMTAAAFLQAYQIVEGVRDENLGAILPIAIVAILMVYVRNKSMVPTKEKRDISKIKLQLIQDYVHTLPGEKINQPDENASFYPDSK
jgi:hypothetical protein